MKNIDENQGIRLSPVYWAGLAIILLIADYFTGPLIHFPITFLVPITLAAWHNGRWWGIVFATGLPLIRLFYELAFWMVTPVDVPAIVNCVIIMVAFLAYAILVDRTAGQTRKLSREVRLLSGFLPICSFCKRIRDDKEQWQPIETYISGKSEVSFSHGICPECLEKHYGEYFKKTD